jgi:hypothetical protein
MSKFPEVEQFYNKNGYYVFTNVLSHTEIDEYRNEIMTYLSQNKNIIMKNCNGFTIPDYIKLPQLEKSASLKEHSKIHANLEILFNGLNYRFCSHNDIGINRMVGWHKDKLNGHYEKYQKHDIWGSAENEKHEIVKVAVYLQDHGNNNGALQVVPGSHMKREINPCGSIYLHPQKGDIVIFDQRITHRGMDTQCADTRILVSLGFGKNNIFTDEFEEGTIQRQNDQNKI